MLCAIDALKCVISVMRLCTVLMSDRRDSISRGFNVSGFNCNNEYSNTLTLAVKDGIATLRFVGVANADLSNWYNVIGAASGAEAWIKANAMPLVGVASCAVCNYLNDVVGFLKITETSDSDVCCLWLVKSNGVPSGTEVNLTFTWLV